ncbi:MAG: SAM-dependent methyltransferase [Spirochaetaceae bacterium]
MPDDTARYYDTNTSRFLRFGRGSSDGAIHRAIWSPGTRRLEQAVHYTDRLVLGDLHEVLGDRQRQGADGDGVDGARSADSTPVVVDLGCGVGGSIAFLERRRPGVYIGITNSSVQRDIAASRARKRGSAAAFRLDDMDDPALYRERLPRRGVDLVMMIESFVHAAAPRVVLGGAARVLRPGGRLVICDDTLGEAPGLARNCDGAAGGGDTDPPRSRRRIRSCEHLLDRFRAGWHVRTLIALEELASAAAASGLTLLRTEDLTSHVEMQRPRDRIIHALVPVIRLLGLRGAFWENLNGGDALQTALRSGLVRYRYMVFEAASSRPSRT